MVGECYGCRKQDGFQKVFHVHNGNKNSEFSASKMEGTKREQLWFMICVEMLLLKQKSGPFECIYFIETVTFGQFFVYFERECIIH